jgi:hypothetical protein
MDVFLRTKMEAKLSEMECDAPDLVTFWLYHQKYLSDATSEKEKLEFLHGCDNVSEVTSPISYHWCEFCGEDGVFHEPHIDQYVCNECGSCQPTTRTVFKTFVPESSIYKHSVHLHQILHEMQCLRESIPQNLIADVRDFLGANFTYERIKKSLRKLGYNQHYSMVYSIQRELDPTFKPLKLSFKQEEQLQGLFFQYISLGKVGGRKNRLNYHFVLGKLADMLEYKFIHPFLHPPKGKKSREESEVIWIEVCKKLNWKLSQK